MGGCRPVGAALGRDQPAPVHEVAVLRVRKPSTSPL